MSATVATEASPAGPFTALVNGLHAKTGGGVTYLKNVLPELAKDPRLDLHLCLRGDQRAVLSGAVEGLRVHWLNPVTGFRRQQLREQIDVPRLARQIGAHVVYSPANFGPFRVRGSVVLLRNAPAVGKVERRLTKRAYWWALTVATWLALAVSGRAVAVSEYARTAMTPGPLAPLRRKITVVPQGVGAPFGGPRSELREPFLLAVGDIYVQKNLHTLIRAFASIAPHRPALTLRIAGRPVDTGYQAALRNEADRLGIANRVTWLGHVQAETLADLYRRCAVFVFPSLVETFGNPLLEAMVCGAPIVCADAAAMPEVVGDAACLFDPLDAQALASAVTRLLDDPQHAETLAARAVARASTYTWARTARETADVLVAAGGR